jgi:hypothetical protein
LLPSVGFDEHGVCFGIRKDLLVEDDEFDAGEVLQQETA